MGWKRNIKKEILSITVAEQFFFFDRRNCVVNFVSFYFHAMWNRCYVVIFRFQGLHDRAAARVVAHDIKFTMGLEQNRLLLALHCFCRKCWAVKQLKPRSTPVAVFSRLIVSPGAAGISRFKRENVVNINTIDSNLFFSSFFFTAHIYAHYICFTNTSEFKVLKALIAQIIYDPFSLAQKK